MEILIKKKSCSPPGFFIDALPDIPGTRCRELIRSIKISAEQPEIFVWLKQLRIAPYSYDFLDNNCTRSPRYTIENLPPLKVNSHFLLAFHIYGFEENRFIAGRFCVPINQPVNRYIQEMYLEYRIQEFGTHSILWFKIRGWFNNNLASKGFFSVFSVVNGIMTRRQLSNIRNLSEELRDGKIKKGIYSLQNHHTESGFLWWLCCRRHNCKGLIT